MSAVAGAPVPLRIDFVSDVVCPWCAIGMASLQQAIAQLGDAVAVDIHVQPFELNPRMAAEGEDAATHLLAKYGMSPEQLAENQQRLRARGAEVGIDFAEGARRIVNTFNAHRLLHWAGVEHGADAQLALKQALLKAYFGAHADVCDHGVLAGIAADTGLDRDSAASVLAGGSFAEEVRAAEQFFQQLGISGVPAVIIERRHLVSGGQPVEVFARALREIAASKAAAGPVAGDA